MSSTASLLSTDQTVGFVQALAAAAHSASIHCGLGDRDLAEVHTSTTLLSNLHRRMGGLPIEVQLSDCLTNGTATVRNGRRVGRLGHRQKAVLAVIDAIECAKELVSHQTSRLQGSCVLAAFAAPGSIDARISSDRPAAKLVLPRGTPIAEGAIDRHEITPPKIVEMLCAKFDRQPADIEVSILRRPYNRDLIAKFTKAGAVVRELEFGDFYAHLRAACPVRRGKPIQVSAGVGGLVEGMAAVPFAKLYRGTLLLQPMELTDDLACSFLAGGGKNPVLSDAELIRSDACVLGVAGITDSVVRGIRFEKPARTACITIMVAAPQMIRPRMFEVRLAAESTISEVFDRVASRE